MDLSIIIVTYNSEKYIRNCIESIAEKTIGIDYEIIIVDNSSKDQTVKVVEEIALNVNNIKIVHSENKGFNHGNNRGIEVSVGKYICLLNPDTILINNAFKIIIDGMDDDENLGIGGAKLLDENLEPTITFGSFPNIYNTFIRSIKLRKYSYYFANTDKQKLFVPYPSGADFLFRRSLLDLVGYMDEKYFLYYDETDFALKIKKTGFKSCIFTNAQILHLQGKSTECISEFAQAQLLKSFVYYSLKNLSYIESTIICYIEILKNKIKLMLKKGNQDYARNELNFYMQALELTKKGGMER